MRLQVKNQLGSVTLFILPTWPTYLSTKSTRRHANNPQSPPFVSRRRPKPPQLMPNQSLQRLQHMPLPPVPLRPALKHQHLRGRHVSPREQLQGVAPEEVDGPFKALLLHPALVEGEGHGRLQRRLGGGGGGGVAARRAAAAAAAAGGAGEEGGGGGGGRDGKGEDGRGGVPDAGAGGAAVQGVAEGHAEVLGEEEEEVRGVPEGGGGGLVGVVGRAEVCGGGGGGGGVGGGGGNGRGRGKRRRAGVEGQLEAADGVGGGEGGGEDGVKRLELLDELAAAAREEKGEAAALL